MSLEWFIYPFHSAAMLYVAGAGIEPTQAYTVSRLWAWHLTIRLSRDVKCGSRGTRTPKPRRTTCFQDRPTNQLSHTSKFKKFPTSVIEQLTQILKMFVQILTAFLFHSIHLVALPITMTSITCLPLQGLPTVNSVCPLSSQDSSSLNSNSPSETYIKCKL